MSASLHALLPVQARELASLLDAYRDAVRMLVADPDDAARRRDVTARMRAMGEIAAMLPALWVPWGEFAVLHFKVLSPRWRVPGIDRSGLPRLAAEHDRSLLRLQQQCRDWSDAQLAKALSAAA